MIVAGQRWRCGRTGRVVVILQADYRGVGPAWHYEDEPEELWRFSVARAFGEWGRYVLIPERLALVGS